MALRATPAVFLASDGSFRGDGFDGIAKLLPFKLSRANPRPPCYDRPPAQAAEPMAVRSDGAGSSLLVARPISQAPSISSRKLARLSGFPLSGGQCPSRLILATKDTDVVVTPLKTCRTPHFIRLLPGGAYQWGYHKAIGYQVKPKTTACP